MLRRIATSLRRQDWIAVAIELVVVVAGVFVGIQVANWNAARQDDAQARDYLQRISADLGSDMANYDRHMAFWADVSRYGATALAVAEGGEKTEADPWKALLAFFQASQTEDALPTRATFDEMMSVGDIGLIRNTDLRGRLAQYYASANNNTLTEARPAYREHVRGLIPLAVQNYIWESCFGLINDSAQRLIDCKSPIQDAKAAKIVATIAADRGLMAELRFWLSTLRAATLIAAGRKDSAAELRQAIAVELGPRADEATP